MTASDPIAQAFDLFERSAQFGQFIASMPAARARSGLTPHAVVHRQNKAALRYFPTEQAPLHPPVFISMPLINTWTVFDLLPDRSVIRGLRSAGVPVYLLDWGRPEIEDRAQTMADLVDGILPRALERAGRHARAHGLPGADLPLSTVGYCVGGTFLAICLARHPGLARKMALLAAPIDFHKSGRLALWARPETFPIDDIVDGYGNFPAELMRESFAWLRPTGQVAKWRTLWERIDDPAFRETWAVMERWSSDNTDFPGEAYREYVRRCYFDNALLPGGDWRLAGAPVDLQRAAMPALALAASDDHICPPDAAFGLARAWGGPVTTRTLEGGHVGVCLSRRLPQALVDWHLSPSP